MKGIGPALLITFLAHLLIKPLWLVTDNLIQDRLGHEVYGLIGALNSLATWASIMADWGLSYVITRSIAQGQKDHLDFYQPATFLKVVLSLSSLAGFWGIGYAMGYRGEALEWLGWVLVYQVVLAGIQYLRAFFQGNQAFKSDALLGNLEKGVILILLYVFWGQINGELYVILLASGGLLSLGFIAYWQRVWYGRLVLRAELASALRLLRRTTPYALMILTSGLNERLSPILLERIAGAHASGLYLGAYRWLSASLMYLWIILPIFFARFARLSANGTGLASTFFFGQLSSAIPLLGVSLVMLVEPELFLLLFRHSTAEEIAEMARNLQILSFYIAFGGIFLIYSNYLTATGHEKGVWFTQALASLVNGLLCVVLIPIYRSNGAAIALVGSCVVSSLALYVLFGLYGPPIRGWKKLPWKLLGSWLGLALALWLLRELLPPAKMGIWAGVALGGFGLYVWLSGFLKLLWYYGRRSG